MQAPMDTTWFHIQMTWGNTNDDCFITQDKSPNPSISCIREEKMRANRRVRTIPNGNGRAPYEGGWFRAGVPGAQFRRGSGAVPARFRAGLPGARFRARGSGWVLRTGWVPYGFRAGSEWAVPGERSGRRRVRGGCSGRGGFWMEQNPSGGRRVTGDNR